MGKVLIIPGREYEAVFTIKASGSTLGVVLTETDTGTFTLVKNGVKPTIVLDKIPMTIEDMDNGKFKLYLTAEQTTGLEGEVGFGEDQYAALPTHKALLDITTVAEGKIYATIPKVYIETLGV